MNIYDGKFSTREKYASRNIHAALGLHLKIYQEFIKLKPDKKSKILVLGSGSGAFEKRLWDKGFKNITSSDINKDQYREINKKITFIKSDLNTDFSNCFLEKYEFIFAIEVIEHLISTNTFLNSLEKISTDKTTIIITTPNLHNTQSRLNYLIFGYPSYFITNPNKYDHINPIFDNVFKHLIKENGFKIIKEYRSTSYFKSFEFYTIRSYFYFVSLALLSFALKPFMRYNKKLLNGVNVAYVIKKTNSPQEQT